MIRFSRIFLMALAALAFGAWAVWAAEGGKAPKGQQIFVESRCTVCHSVKALGIEKKSVAGEEGSAEATASTTKPPDLSGVGTKHTSAWMSKWLLREEKMHDKLHRKKFRGTDAELKDLTEWLATLKTDESGKALKSEKSEEAKPEAATEEKKAATEEKKADEKAPEGETK